ncbi:MAG: M1 family metallopeptidase, partial [Flavobacteriales bacterium]
QGDFFMLWAKPTAKGYIDSLDFKVNNTPANWDYFEDQEDIAVLTLPQPLAPGASITVSTPFFVKLPSGSISRLGHIEQSYQITQWYPKPAVYDKDGWHPIPYLTQGEFYSEFGSFDVKITLPENYTVGATGDLQTQSEIDRLNKLAGEEGPSNDDFPASSTSMKTLHYKQSNVHDFGWFADKRWIVRKGELELPHSKKKVTTWAMFTHGNKSIWEEEGIKSINDGLYYYSLWSGDYPYDVCTAVDGTISAGGGMEYPNVTVIGNSGNATQLRTVIIHEVGHNWFYGILGSNERDNAWMDEGINSFFETRSIMATRKDSADAIDAMIQIGQLDIKKILGLENISYAYLTEELPYLIAARTGEDQPIQAPSDDYTNLNYGGIVYKKTALAFNYLMQYLGEDMMNRCMAAYFEAWKFKHPSPADIEAVFEATSGKNLDWFFQELIPSTLHVDYAVKGLRKTDSGYSVKVCNRGDIASPFSIEVSRNGNEKSLAWNDGIEPGKSTRINLAAEKGDRIRVNSVTGIPEYNRNNNNLHTDGLFHTLEPTTLKVLSSIDNPETSQLFWIPLVGWNEYNKWMLGVNLHNRTIPRKNFQWSISPMYSFYTGSINGLGSIEYNNGSWSGGVNARRFAHSSLTYTNETAVLTYDVINPYIQAKLFPNRVRKDWSGSVQLSYFSMLELVKYTRKPVFDEFRYVRQGYGSSIRKGHWRLEATVAKKLPRSTFRLRSTAEMGDFTDGTIVQQHTLEHDWIYKGKGAKKIRTRLYAGMSNGFYLNLAGQYGGARSNSMSPGNTLRNDYLYEGLFLGRDQETGFMSQQFMRTQGGLAAPTTQSANRLLLSLNSEMEVPFKLPLSVYGGAAFLKNEADVKAFPPSQGSPTSLPAPTDYSNRIAWNAGVAVRIIPNIFKIYVPIVYSSNIGDEVDARSLNFAQCILFELNLQGMNPFKITETVANR